ncbi:MAG: hypothetical protein ACXVYV_02145 [Gaiellales bacterium]
MAASTSRSGTTSRQDGVLVTAFHPELTDDTRLHRCFARMVAESRRVIAA